MRVALLIDLENLDGSRKANSDLSILDIHEIVRPLLVKVDSESEQDQLVSKEYFSVRPATGELSDVFTLNGVSHRPSVGRKNAADITLACHAVQLLLRDDIQRFYVVSGDSDMIDLALFLQTAGLHQTGQSGECHLLPLAPKKNQISDQLFRWAKQHEDKGQSRLHFLSDWLDLDELAKRKRAEEGERDVPYARSLVQLMWVRWTREPRGFLWRESDFLEWGSSASSAFAGLSLQGAQASSIIAESLKNFRFAGHDRQRFSYAQQGLRRTLVAADVAMERVGRTRQREASFGDVIGAIDEVPSQYRPTDLRPNELLQLAVAAGLLSQTGDTISIADESAPFGPISGMRRVILAAAATRKPQVRWSVFLDPFARSLFRMPFGRLSQMEKTRVEEVRKALVNQASIQAIVLKCDEAGQLHDNGRLLKINSEHELVQETIRQAKRVLELVVDEPYEDVLLERMQAGSEICCCPQERRSLVEALIAAGVLKVAGQPRRLSSGRFGL